MSSTPVKTDRGASYVADILKFPSEWVLKRSAGVAFVIDEEEEDMCEKYQSGEMRKSNDGEWCRIAKSTVAWTT